jgi:hypothetical protein
MKKGKIATLAVKAEGLKLETEGKNPGMIPEFPFRARSTSS